MEKIRALLEKASKHSTCHLVKLGVVIETPASEYVLGWNGPPEKAGPHSKCRVNKHITPRNVGECPSVHAEVRAICRAAEKGSPIAGGTLYLSKWFCCAPCAIAMIEAGIAKLVLTEKIEYEMDDCYHFRLAEDLLKRSKVTIEIIESLHPRHIIT